jgi:hypothetical protein
VKKLQCSNYDNIRKYSTKLPYEKENSVGIWFVNDTGYLAGQFIGM